MRKSPREIAESAVNRLCAYDAVSAPGDCQTTEERVAEFLREFVLILSPRLQAAARGVAASEPPRESVTVVPGEQMPRSGIYQVSRSGDCGLLLTRLDHT